MSVPETQTSITESNMLLYSRLGQSIKKQEQLINRYKLVDQVLVSFNNMFANLGMNLIQSIMVLHNSIAQLIEVFSYQFTDEGGHQAKLAEIQHKTLESIYIQFQDNIGEIDAQAIQPFRDAAESLDSKESKKGLDSFKSGVVSTVAAGPKAALMSAAMESLMNIISPLLDLLDPFLMITEVLGKKIEQFLAPALKFLYDMMMPVVHLLFGQSPGLIPGFQLLFEAGKKLVDIALYPIITGFELLMEFGGRVARAFDDVFGTEGLIFGIWEDLIDILKVPVNAVIGGINTVIETINNTLPVDIDTIPKLATGGLVTSPTVAMIGEGNDDEHVIPDRKLRGYFEHLEFQFEKEIRAQTQAMVRERRRLLR